MSYSPKPQVTLFQSPSNFAWSTYHQSKIKVLGDNTATPVSGTFHARSSTVEVDVEIAATNLGGAWASLWLAVGVTANAVTTPLFTPLTFPLPVAAAGVSQFQYLPAGILDIDYVGGPMRRKVVVSGLTPGTTYTWQLTAVIAASSSVNTLANSPASGYLARSADGNWVAVSLLGSNQVQIIHAGARPAWRLGAPNANSANPNMLGGSWLSVVQTAITVGTAPAALAFSPDSTKLAVANFTPGTITFINVLTNAIIGTSAIVHGAGTNAYGVAWLKDSSAVLVSQSDGSLNLVTAVASPVITNVATGGTGFIVHGLRRRDVNSTDNFWVASIPNVLQGHITSGAWTQDFSTALTSATNFPAGNMVVDGSGNLWIGVTGGTYDKKAVKLAPGTTTVATSFTPKAGQAVSGLATTADGEELWVFAGDGTVGAVQTSDGALTQDWLPASYIQPKGTSPSIKAITESQDGYLYFAATSTPASGLGGPIILENPSSIVNFVSGGGLVQTHVLVTATGVS